MICPRAMAPIQLVPWIRALARSETANPRANSVWFYRKISTGTLKPVLPMIHSQETYLAARGMYCGGRILTTVMQVDSRRTPEHGSSVMGDLRSCLTF